MELWVWRKLEQMKLANNCNKITHQFWNLAKNTRFLHALVCCSDFNHTFATVPPQQITSRCACVNLHAPIKVLIWCGSMCFWALIVWGSGGKTAMRKWLLHSPQTQQCVGGTASNTGNLSPQIRRAFDEGLDHITARYQLLVFWLT